MLISSPKKINLDFKESLYLGNDLCFVLSDDKVEQCREFAKGTVKYNGYLEEQRGANPRKTSKQAAYSKLAEFAASEYLALNGMYSKVDTNLYDSYNKNWNADLGNNFGVKSTSLAMSEFISKNTNHQSTESWTFQFKNKCGIGGTDKEVFGLREEEQYKKFYIFTTVEHEEIKSGTKVWIRAVWILSLLFKFNFFKDPIKRDLKGMKKNIYDGDLKRAHQEMLKLNREKLILV